MKVIGYARVSTKDQNIDIQISEIQKLCKYRNFELLNIFEDKASGKNIERSGYQNMIKYLEMNPSVNAVIVYKLDRLGRSILDLIRITNWLKEKDIAFISITNAIDTTTKEGRLFFYMMAALGEYERELIIERTQLGIQYAKEQGRIGGRPNKSIPLDTVNQLILSGIPKTRIAKQLGIDITTLYRKMNKAKKNITQIAGT